MCDGIDERILIGFYIRILCIFKFYVVFYLWDGSCVVFKYVYNIELGEV